MALPALNGVHTDDDPVGLETERVWSTLPKDLVASIEDFHHHNRLKNRSQAIKRLIEYGLAYVAEGSRN